MPLPPSFPDLASLDLFSTVVSLGSVSQAAAAHAIAQPSASARLNNLERQLGVTLLERGPTGSRPTPAGHLVAEWVEAVLRSANELAIGVDALKARSRGRLRLIASYTIAEYLLPAWLSRFHRVHPDNPVELEVANSAEVVARIRSGRTDLGFIESPTPATGLSTVTVAEDELVAVVAPTHPWGRRKAVDAERLASTALVLREVGSGTREFLEQALAAAGLGAPIPAFELGSTAAVKSSVAAGGSPTVLSRLAVEADDAAGVLRMIPISDLPLRRSLRAVWRTDRSLPAAAASLLAQLQA